MDMNTTQKEMTMAHEFYLWALKQVVNAIRDEDPIPVLIVDENGIYQKAHKIRLEPTMGIPEKCAFIIEATPRRIINDKGKDMRELQLENKLRQAANRLVDFACMLENILFDDALGVAIYMRQEAQRIDNFLAAPDLESTDDKHQPNQR